CRPRAHPAGGPGAGALCADGGGKSAVLAKPTRNATIGSVVLGYAIYWARRGAARAVGGAGGFLWQKFPKFVLGFLCISALATAGVFAGSQITDLANLSRWAFLFSFAGIGLRTNSRSLTRQGWRPVVVGVAGEFAIATLTLALVVSVSQFL